MGGPSPAEQAETDHAAGNEGEGHGLGNSHAPIDGALGDDSESGGIVRLESHGGVRVWQITSGAAGSPRGDRRRSVLMLPALITSRGRTATHGGDRGPGAY